MDLSLLDFISSFRKLKNYIPVYSVGIAGVVSGHCGSSSVVSSGVATKVQNE